MSIQSARAFRAEVNSNRELQDIVATLWDLDGLVALGRSRGHDFNHVEALSVIAATYTAGEFTAFEQALHDKDIAARERRSDGTRPSLDAALILAQENDELSDFELELVSGGQPSCMKNCAVQGPG